MTEIQDQLPTPVEPDHLLNAVNAQRITDRALEAGEITPADHAIVTASLENVRNRHGGGVVDPGEHYAHDAQRKANDALQAGEVSPEQHALLTQTFDIARQNAEERTAANLRRLGA